ncbi:MAG: type 1 glutamine amidotransferase [Ilumatobacteraceae bacterium]
MRALIVQHEHDGPGGLLADHLAGRGYEVEVLQVMQQGSTHSDVAYPEPTQYDVIVPLGSVHGVYETDIIGSWVHREIDMLRTAHDAGVPMFGICFGAQALTTALGGTVEKAPAYEIGWYHYESDVPDAIPAGPWFTWHGDRCLLPDGVTELARTEMCTQAFRSGTTVGVQFHPEVTRELVQAWADQVPAAYFEALAVSPDEVIAGFAQHGDTARRQAVAMFDWFLDEVAPS